MGIGIVSIGSAHDNAGAGPFLWRPGAEEKCSFPVNAMFHHFVCYQLTVDFIRILFNIWSGYRSWYHRRLRLGWSEGSRGAAKSRLLGDYSPLCFHDLPMYVRRHHPGIDVWRFCGADEIFRLPHLYDSLGDLCL